MYNKYYLDLRDFENILKSKNYSDRTIINYSVSLIDFLKYINKPRSHISLIDADKYIIKIKNKSYSKKNQAISSIKLYYKFILNKNLKTNKLERPRIIDKKLLLSKINKIDNIKHLTIISIAYSVGLRVSEVINLKIKDIDSDRMLIFIKNAKGGNDRIVPLSMKILKLLRIYYKKYKPLEYLFNGQNSLLYSANSCNKIVKKYIGNDYHFHLLRHSCFTHLLESGVDIRYIQNIAGHKSIKTTEIYTHISIDKLRSIELPI